MVPRTPELNQSRGVSSAYLPLAIKGYEWVREATFVVLAFYLDEKSAIFALLQKKNRTMTYAPKFCS